MKSAVYVRQSHDRQGDEAGVLRQQEDATALAAVRGWPVVEILKDNDVSANGTKRRPGFERLLELIESRAVGAVVAWDLTRLSRNARDRLRLIEAGRNAGVVIALVRGSDMDLGTPSGRLTADILASVAQHEIEVKGDRQRRAIRQAVEAGRRIGGRRPFGYEPDGVTIRDVEADLVRRAYQDVRSGVPLAAIARSLTASGVPTSQGSAVWRSSTVRDMLLNPRYSGMRGHGSVPERGRRRIEVKGAAEWPALVSEADWRQAVGILTDPARRTAPKSATALLTGWAVCAVCASHVHGGREAASGARTIRCSGTPGHLARRAEPVEDYIERLVIARLSRPDAVDLLAAPTSAVDVAALRSERVALRSRMDEAAALFTAGQIEAAQLVSITDGARARIGAIEQEISEAGRVDVLGPLVAAENVAEAWAELDMSRRRAVASLLLRVVVHPPGRGARTFRPESVEVTWR